VGAYPSRVLTQTYHDTFYQFLAHLSSNADIYTPRLHANMPEQQERSLETRASGLPPRPPRPPGPLPQLLSQGWVPPPPKRRDSSLPAPPVPSSGQTYRLSSFTAERGVRMTSSSVRDYVEGHLRAQDAGTGTLKPKTMKQNPRDHIPSQAPHVPPDSRLYRLSSFTSERGGKLSTSTIISSS
jgi:hypothetical protein